MRDPVGFRSSSRSTDLGILLALASALVWGSGDFAGGAVRLEALPAASLVWAVAAGVCGAGGFAVR